MVAVRKKPIVVNAWRAGDLWKALAVDPPIARQLPEAVALGNARGELLFLYTANGSEILVKTLEGDMRADADDWIIQGVNGEFYPCKPDVFDKSYEIVSESAGPQPATEG